ncbi:hypothetical protein LIER_08907 [Lithospermum erythrorhizon]|uniref:Maturase K n=1 Tax=Lithospermum erythrorhizon TaxID=34254 RepID=A0AAV3PGL2_LITER
MEYKRIQDFLKYRNPGKNFPILVTEYVMRLSNNLRLYQHLWISIVALYFSKAKKDTVKPSAPIVGPQAMFVILERLQGSSYPQLSRSALLILFASSNYNLLSKLREPDRGMT